ncbi:ATP-binding protein [Achromobacter seleniivolatilans]|uniref:histidine kinase n=1 Tax=Achromobacter seleniivolatilans TaxID=3047478 RepID=A0ABY9M524_9BURK|nr:ATP-binding protein [Achromobacter sp. R39]WMD22118.1 ATP-binding protein [Achromobacter sp. R39]
MRLLAGILVTLLLSWLIQFSFYWADVVKENTGARDRDLMNTAQVALLSVASTTARLSKDASCSQDGRWIAPQSKNALLAFDLTSGRLVFSSIDAPSTSIAELGKSGFSTRYVDADGWRVYSAIDAEARTQVVVASPLSLSQQQFRDRFSFGALITFILVLAVGGVAILISSIALKPVSAITRSLRQRDVMDLSPLCEKHVPIEIRPLIVALNQQHIRLKTAMENERTFLSNAAHELRTPLAVLTVQTENALRTDDIDEVKALLRKIAATTQRSSRLAEQLLDLARMESSDVSMAPKTLDLSAVVELVSRDIQMIAVEKSQRILMDLNPCLVQGNIDLIGILVRNLLDNACRYTQHAGCILVQCGNIDGEARLTVMDDGPGVPLHEREKIFDRFYRVPGSAGQGSGIGLSLVARIAHQHQAKIEILAGIAGNGVAFSITFPEL